MLRRAAVNAARQHPAQLVPACTCFQNLRTKSTIAERAKAPSWPPRSAAASLPQHRQNGRPFDDSYHLTDRIKLLSKRDQLGEAVNLVKASPPSAATVVVWNVLINELLKGGDIKRGYQTWMDMKRRGIVPTARSYVTFFGALARNNFARFTNEDKSRILTVWKQWEVYAEKVLSERTSNVLSRTGGKAQRGFVEQELIVENGTRGEILDSAEDISNLPANHYLQFLGQQPGGSKAVLEVLSTLPKEGPLAATSITYSIALAGMRKSELDSAEKFETALDLWNKIKSDSPADGIDTKTISIMISICRDAAKRPDDQKVGLEIAKEFYGFVDPGQEFNLVDSKKLGKAQTAMDSAAFSNVLTLGLEMQQFNLVVAWFNQVRDYPKRFGANLIENLQCDLVLSAYAMKRDSEQAEELIRWILSPKSGLSPTESNFLNALQVCWKGEDLTRAYRILSIMVQKPIGPEMETSPAAALPKMRQSAIEPDDRCLDVLLKTGLATRDRGEIYRTIQIIEKQFNRDENYFQINSIPDDKIDSDESRFPRSPFRSKLANTLERALERVLQGGEKHLSAERRKQLELRKRQLLKLLEVTFNKAERIPKERPRPTSRDSRVNAVNSSAQGHLPRVNHLASSQRTGQNSHERKKQDRFDKRSNFDSSNPKTDRSFRSDDMKFQREEFYSQRGDTRPENSNRSSYAPGFRRNEFEFTASRRRI